MVQEGGVDGLQVMQIMQLLSPFPGKKILTW